LDSRFQRVAEHFERARHLADAARAAYLDSECEAELRDEVAALLAAHEDDRDDRRDSAILPGLGEAVTAAWGATQAEPPPPELVEGFRIRERIGAGGMGTVYAAEQIEPARRVALKVLRPEADRDRFRREVLALARLQHPGIAQILLSGECVTPLGTSPYLAMELVEGVPIDRFAQALDRRARIELMILVCDAVAHAHRRGIIHRDLKPSNILVTPTGQPKVLDFGLARAVDDSEDEFGRRTRTGHLVGTLAYMSPEQATGSREAVDTRSDVYSLGVIAYEILTSRLPHALDAMPLPLALRTLTDEDPDAAPDVRGDLWIVLRKALSKDPEVRYGGADAFAADLRRYLDDEPIEARPPSALYQLRKFVRRHKAPVAGAVATVLALVVGLVFAVRAAHRESVERTRADAERDIARAAAAHAYLKAAVGDMVRYEFDSARKNLQQIAPEFRDWEWAYLQAQLDRSLEFRPAPGHTWWELPPELAEAELGGRFVGHRYRVEQDLARQTVHLVPPPPGEPVVLEGVSGPAGPLRVSSNGNRIVLLQRGGARTSSRILVYGREGGAPRQSLVGTTTARGVFALDPDGAHVAYGGYLGWMRIYDLESGAQLVRTVGHGRDSVSAVAWGPDGLIATGGLDRAIELRDAATGALLRRLRGHTGAISSLLFTEGGATLLSGALDGSIRIWDVASGALRRVLAVPVLDVGGLALGADPQDLWALCGDGLRRWRLDDERLDVFRFHKSWIYGVTFHPDGHTLAASAFQGSLRILDWERGLRRKTLPRGYDWDLEFAPDGDLYTSTDRLRAPDWSADATERVATWARAIAVTPSGDRVAGGSIDGGIEIYRPADRSVEATWEKLPQRPESMDFSADGRRLAIGGQRGMLQVRSVPDGRLLWERTLRGNVDAVAFHPSRPLLASAGGDAVIRIWDAETGELHRRLEGHTARIWALKFHPGGTRLVSGSHDATVRIWDPDSGLEKLRLTGHENYIYHLDFSPDGTALATGSGDCTVRIWSTRPMRERWRESRE